MLAKLYFYPGGRSDGHTCYVCNGSIAPGFSHWYYTVDRHRHYHCIDCPPNETDRIRDAIHRWWQRTKELLEAAATQPLTTENIRTLKIASASLLWYVNKAETSHTGIRRGRKKLREIQRTRLRVLAHRAELCRWLEHVEALGPRPDVAITFTYAGCPEHYPEDYADALEEYQRQADKAGEWDDRLQALSEHLPLLESY